MWKVATRHFASNEWDSKGILDSNERPWRHMAQNCIKINLTKAPFNLLPGDKVIVLSRTNKGGLWWDRWRRQHQHKISDSIQNLWQDLHDDDKTCMQLSYWELILENGQWLECWITDRLCALPVTDWTGIHGFGYLSPLIWIAPFSAHKLIGQDTAVLHQAIIV
jgi:hypothetical protein